MKEKIHPQYGEAVVDVLVAKPLLPVLPRRN